MENITILRAIHDDLQPFVETQLKGKLSISGTYVETLDVLSVSQSGFLCIMEWLGEASTSEEGQPYVGVVRNEVGIYLAINPGLPIKRGQALWLSDTGHTLLERCNQIRDRVREIVLPDNEDTSREFDYRECRQVVTPDGIPLRAYRLAFGIFNSIPDPEYRNVNP
jgi:hypothetical protein